MGQTVRWQAIIAAVGAVLLIVYLRSIVIVTHTVVVPAEGGTYREGLVGSAQYLNPLLAEYNPVDADITSLIFQGLTRDDGSGTLIPVLAESWNISSDGRFYEFTLRPNLRWSDGEPVTVDDVIFTYSLIQSPDFPGNPALQTLWQTVSLTRITDRTVRFVLKEPLPSFAYYTTTGILPAHILGDMPAADLLTHPFNLSPVGTGPFKLKEATESHILLTRNPRYWGKPTRIEQIDFRFFPNSQAALAALQAEAIDGIGRVEADMLPQLRADPTVQLFSAPLPRYSEVLFNLQQPDALPFFQDSQVRRAMLMALDRQLLIDTVLPGQATPANSPILSQNWAFNPTQTYPEFNPAQAAALLDEAGWQDSDGDGIRDNAGAPLAFTLLTSDAPTQRRVADELARQWQQTGIRVTVESAGGKLPARLSNRQFEAALVEIDLLGDPDLYRFWHQTQIAGGQNFAGWDNVPASEALEQGRIHLEQTDRIQYYYNFQRIFAEETPSLILYYPVYTFALHNTVKNVQLANVYSPSDRFQNLAEWYLLTRRVIETTANQNFSSGN